MPFKSEKQSAWAFATDQPFAKRWAKQTDYDELPDYVPRKKPAKQRQTKTPLQKAILGREE